MEESRQQCFLFADFGNSGRVLSAFKWLEAAGLQLWLETVRLQFSPRAAAG
jgi:hypothetical protein